MPRIDLLQVRGGTSSDWTTANPVLAVNEPGYETDTRKIKFGNGVSSWNALTYSFDTSGNQAFKGYYATELALTTAFPTALNGDYAIVGATNTIWVWDTDTDDWVNSGDTTQDITIDAAPTDGSNNAVSSNGVFDALASKAAVVHTHGVADVTGLQAALDSKIAASGFVPVSPASNVITIPLNKENLKYRSTLTGSYTYEFGTVVDGANLIHKVNTGAVGTVITITFDTSYTHKILNETKTTYQLPAGTGKEYFITFLVEGSTIEVSVIDGTGTGGGGGGGTSDYNALTSRPTINGVTVEGEINDNIMLVPATGATAQTGDPVSQDTIAVYLGKLRELASSVHRLSLSRTAHGLTKGDVFKDNGTTVTKAIATSEAAAVFDYIAFNIPDANTIMSHVMGNITHTGIVDEAGNPLAADTIYYLSATTAGKLTATKPAIAVPILKTTSGTKAHLLPVLPQGTSGGGGTSNYNDLTNKPTLLLSGDTTVDFSGDMSDDILNMKMTGAAAINAIPAESNQLKQYLGAGRSLLQNHWRSLAITAHGLVLGDLFRTNGTTVTKAIATSEANAGIDYVAFSITSVNAVMGQRSGHFTCTGVTDDTGAALLADTTYYLSPTVAGKVTATEPSNFSTPVFRTTTATNAVILLHRTRVNTSGGVTNPLDLTEISQPSAPPADTARLYAVDVNGITVLEYMSSTGFVARVLRDSLFIAKNESGSIITKGTPVYISGVTTTGGIVPIVLPARSNSLTTMPCVGLAAQDIPATNGFGRILVEGRIDNINTSAYTTNTRLWVSDATAGALSNTRPAPPNLDQRVAIVIRSHASAGSILVDTKTMLGELLGTINNSFSIGDGLAGNKRIIANNADGAKPEIRYNDTSNAWEFSNNGSTFTAFGSGSSASSTYQNVTIPNGTTTLNFATATIQNTTISEAKNITSVLNPVLGETREFIFDGTHNVTFDASILGVKQNSFKLGETNRVLVYSEFVDAVTPANNRYIITFVNSNEGVADGSITNDKLATNVKVGSLALLNSTAKGSVQEAFNEIWNKTAANITTGKTTQVAFNNNGVLDGSVDFTWNNSTKVLEAKGDGTSAVIELDEGAASGNSGFKIPNTKSSSGRFFTASDDYMDFDTSLKRIQLRQVVRNVLGSSVVIKTGGVATSTAAAAVTLESIAVPTDSIITIETRVDAKVTALTTISSKKIIGTFRNVAGTLSQVGSTASLYTAAMGSYDGTTTGVPSFVISGTNVLLNFAGAASITADVTSVSITKYN